jgi:hypothetical protein
MSSKIVICGRRTPIFNESSVSASVKMAWPTARAQKPPSSPVENLKNQLHHVRVSEKNCCRAVSDAIIHANNLLIHVAINWHPAATLIFVSKETQ